MPLRVGICTQTPLLRFELGQEAPVGPTTLETLQRPYHYSPGGVCRMVLPTLRAWHQSGILGEAHWWSLQPGAPQVVGLEGLPLGICHLFLPEEGLAAYARTKEKMWAEIHGFESPPWKAEDFRFYAHYNWFNVEALLKDAKSMDVAYIHDFQLLQVGALLGLAAPSVLRWHVPFSPERIPGYTRRFLVKCMEDFDAVIVSTRRDLEGLIRAGFEGKAAQIYPHIDPDHWPDVTRDDVARLEAAWGLGEDDPLVLCVARMDPMKRQDVAIQAMARLARRHPRAKLALVGNGSFSANNLGVTKSTQWKGHLESVAASTGVKDLVHFAHHIPDSLLAAAYERADVVVLPSDIEGFGLTTLEAWRFRTPAVVSEGAGASELVHDGLNGYSFPPGRPDALAERLGALLLDEGLRQQQGEAGHAALSSLGVATAAAREAEILKEAIEDFRQP